jgi:2-polyprenyl-3-methyl-5-hydroxy-6-metoxy-1,4-benzoquinol methylase
MNQPKLILSWPIVKNYFRLFFSDPKRAFWKAFAIVDERVRLTQRVKVYNYGERLVLADRYNGETTQTLDTLLHLVRYEWVEQLTRDMKEIDFLDDGCGSGYGTHYLASQGIKSITGTDLDSSAVRYAKRHYKLGNLRFMVMDSCHLGFETESFGCVISFHVIEHVPAECQPVLIRETARVLKPDGVFFIGCPNGRVADTDNRFHMHELSAQELTDNLKKYYADVTLFGQDVMLGGTRLKHDWLRAAGIQGLSPENIIITDEDIDRCCGLLAICRSPYR